jgi:hypothetical protein
MTGRQVLIYSLKRISLYPVFGDEELLEGVSRIQGSYLEGSNRLNVERTGCTAFTIRFLSPLPTVGDKGTENL